MTLRSLLIPPLVHFQAAGIQQTLLQHLCQDLHVRALLAGFPAVASLEAAVHRLSEASARCVCKSLTLECIAGGWWWGAVCVFRFVLICPFMTVLHFSCLSLSLWDNGLNRLFLQFADAEAYFAPCATDSTVNNCLVCNYSVFWLKCLPFLWFLLVQI